MTASPSERPVRAATGIPEDVRRLVEELAALRRESASAGEAAAAARIAEHLQGLGLNARLESHRVHWTYWWPLGLAAAAATAAAFMPRRAGSLVALAASLATVDELWIGPRILRRVLPKRITTNVSASIGADHADEVVVVHAHHDAAHSGIVFHPRLRTARPRRALVRLRRATLPDMWPVVMPPLLVLAGQLLDRRDLRASGGLGGAVATAVFAQIGRSPVVPGGLDNLSGVAAALTLARRLAEDPPARRRVLVVSAGSEEAFLEGMRAWCRDHAAELPRSARFVCLESVGCDRLVTLDGEGFLKLHRHSGDLGAALHSAAQRAGVRMGPPYRYRLATDAQEPRKRGFATAVLTSIDDDGKLRNYHWPSDSPERLDWRSVAAAARVVLELIGDGSPELVVSQKTRQT